MYVVKYNFPLSNPVEFFKYYEKKFDWIDQMQLYLVQSQLVHKHKKQSISWKGHEFWKFKLKILPKLLEKIVLYFETSQQIYYAPPSANKQIVDQSKPWNRDKSKQNS